MIRLVQSMQRDPDHPAMPCLVLSNTADAGGLAKARAMGVPTAVVDHRPFGADRPAFETELMMPLMDARPDIICLAGFMRVLTGEFVDYWRGRMLNIHPSLLPKYKGSAHPCPRAGGRGSGTWLHRAPRHGGAG